MTLEELKAAWEAAVVALEAKPDDEGLKEAADAAKAAYDTKKAEEDDESDDEDPDKKKGNPKWDAETQKYIKKLRDENARNRTSKKQADERLKAVLKAAGIEDESEAPEARLKVKEAETNNLAFRAAILESAIENGIAKDDLDYYEFLITKATSALEEGEELSEEQITEIVEKVSKKGSANSSVGTGGKDGKGGKPPPKPGASGEVSLAAFVKMSVLQKSDLYLKDKDLYNRLTAEAKAKKQLV